MDSINLLLEKYFEYLLLEKGLANLTLYSYKFDLQRYIKFLNEKNIIDLNIICLLYTSDAADERSSVDLGGRRIIKKKNKKK